MSGFELFKNDILAPIVIDANTVFGIPKMTKIFAEDIKRVTGKTPEIKNEISAEDEFLTVVGVVGDKILTDCFKDKIDFSCLEGKKEVYGIYFLEDAVNSGQKIMAIIGSDKRGAIYGMFHVSEIIGVSPWYFWADATVKRQSEIVLSEEIACISKEPSVRYRGFFINDEQPCFGNWAKENYGSISPCPILYEKIFELLLRLKGNYLWPAMWRSDFTLDYFKNAELANEMGVVMGASHHEPCCRSGQEFQKLRHDNPQYGEDWSFLSNAEGITEFWKDGLIRNKNFENLITIGMRGENDSYLMPENATLEDNINVLKAAITKQKELISEYAPSEHPQLLALYKEVEDYYYGDENTKGLKDWDVLDNDIMMLCDDNFANVRTLPDDELRKKPGGFGMYYHFDYFGSPVSYLWINSSPLSKVWEQMTMAYDYGVRSAWIVNVGDIKNQELPLSYFIDLAYDFDKWGTNAINKTKEYTKLWLEKNGFEKDIAKEGAELITEYVSLNGKRRPEALKSTTYHASHENEAKNMLAEIEKMLRRTEALYEKVKGSDLEECFFQLIFYPVNAVALINKMHLFGSLNDLYIRQRRKTANVYAKLIQKCIEREQKLTEEYHTRNNGKWNHMQSVYHIGFTNWNDEQCEYPISSFYNPVKDSRLLVSLSNREDWTGAHRWTRHVLNMPLCFDTNASGVFEVSNGGEKLLMYRIDWDVEWLEIKNLNDGSKVEKNSQLKVDDTCSFEIRILKDKWDGTEKSMVRIYGDDCEIVADESENSTSVTMVELMVEATALNLSGVDKECFLETDGCISIEAVNYQDCKATKAGEYKVIDDYGRTAGGMKVYPQTIRFENTMDAPELGYNVFAVSDGDYICDIYTSASNPVVYKGKMEIGVKANDGNAINVNTIPDVDFVPWKSESWSEGVLDQIHISECKLSLHQGLNTIKIFAIDPAVVIEKIVLWNPNTGKRKSYLGPVESKIYKV